MDILNFISWIKGGKYSPTIPTDAVTVVGVPNPTRGDAYLPVTVPVTAIGALFPFPPFPTSNTNIGKLLGGGIVVAEWDENGVKKALVASLTNLAGNIVWTVPAKQTTALFPLGQSLYDGFTNTNAIITQTGAPATTAYAAGLARLFAGGGFNDWYLPSMWELNMCYDAAGIVNKVLGSTNGFTGYYYWSSSEAVSSQAYVKYFQIGVQQNFNKSGVNRVRAVRIHNL